jgi:hypothetical protein
MPLSHLNLQQSSAGAARGETVSSERAGTGMFRVALTLSSLW